MQRVRANHLDAISSAHRVCRMWPGVFRHQGFFAVALWYSHVRGQGAGVLKENLMCQIKAKRRGITREDGSPPWHPCICMHGCGRQSAATDSERWFVVAPMVPQHVVMPHARGKGNAASLRLEKQGWQAPPVMSRDTPGMPTQKRQPKHVST